MWTNEKKPGEGWFHKNSLTPRSFISLIQEGHPSLAVDGDEDTSLHNCAIMDNYYTERPTLVINLGKLTSIGGLVIKTWQGKGQDSNFAYRDYMYGLDRFSVFVDRRPLGNYPIAPSAQNQIISYGNQNSNDSIVNILSNDIESSNTTQYDGGVPSSRKTKSLANGISVGQPASLNAAGSKLRLNEHNLCNFVTRSNYAIFSPQIHLQCIKPITGRYLYIQADGRSNRWSRLFSAVLCEVQVYEL